MIKPIITGLLYALCIILAFIIVMPPIYRFADWWWSLVISTPIGG